VATTGNDVNLGGQSQPFRTIKKGISVLQPGDTLYIRQGTYEERISPTIMTIPAGTSWVNAITIAGYPGETVILRAINLQDNLNLSVVAYLIFDNLVIDPGGTAGQITNTGNAFRTAGNTHHIRLQNSELRNSNDVLIFSTETVSSVEILNNRIHDAFVSLFSGTHPTTGNYGLYVKFHNSLVEGNTIYNNTGYGIHHYGSGLNTVSNNIIRNNRIYGNGFNDGERGNTNGGLIIASGGSNLCYNNLVYGNTGTGISVAYTGGQINNQIYNNTVYNNTVVGIEINTSAPQSVVLNNIVYGNGNAIVDLATGTIKTNNLTTAPQFGNAAANDFSLQAGSPAINAGTVVSAVTTDIQGTARPQGGAFDIGAYEYSTGSSMVAGPNNLRIVSP
jgi:parallel beta-helix repeat protein